MNKTISVINNENEESDIESKWFLIDYNENTQSINVKLKESEVKEIFSSIRAKYEYDLEECNENSATRTIAGKYGNAVSSLKRSIMQEFVIVVAGLFLHYFEIDSTYATAKSVINDLFGLSVKREVILSSFSTKIKQWQRFTLDISAE